MTPAAKFKFSLRERSMIGLVSVAIFLATYHFGVKKQEAQISQLQEQVEREEATLAERKKTVVELSQKSQAQKVSTQDEQNRKYLEASRYLSNVLRSLGADKDHKDFKVNSIDVTTYDRVSNLYRSSLKLEVETSFIDLGNFLSSLNKAEVLIDIQSIKLSRIDNELKRCLASIEVHGYYDGEKE